MSSNRRDFLKNTVLAAPGAALIGSPRQLEENGSSSDSNHTPANDLIQNGWLNVKDCGASGSTYNTTASTSSGSKKITVIDPGDFKVGQGVMVSKCNVHYERIQMWGEGIPYFTHKKEVGNSVDVRGYDRNAGSWMVYVLDIAPSSAPAFRWSDDLARTWHPEVSITHGWQSLGGGVEVRLNERDWEAGYVITFGVRDQLISRIEKIEGNILTLEDEANRTVDDAVVRHNDTLALQGAIDRAIREKLNVFVPVGHYMLAKTISVSNAHAIAITGASSEDTVLDISEGVGACFTVSEGTEVMIRNFRMIGFMGFDERDKANSLKTRGSTYIWGFGLKHCNAVTIRNTERVLVENCHASRMSGECFVANGRSRGAAKPGHSNTVGITYLRCSATDLARNAFNDQMVGAENTAVLNCRIVDVGGNAWEGASRFVRFIGNYVRNAGPIGMGNIGPANRDETFPDLGAGQHIVADNVFEGYVPYATNAICSRVGPTQVIIRNNLFINFNSCAVEIRGESYATHYPSSNTLITGNIFDMTCVGQKPIDRIAINVSANDTIISDNQIYVRGTVDPLVTAILIHEPALNVNVHDNLIRNCGTGIITERGASMIGKVVNNQTFIRSDRPFGLPIERIRPEMSRGWILVWRNDDQSQNYTGMSVIESFDPEALSFRLRESHSMKAGDRFEIIVPMLNWNLHHNTITDCLRPVVLHSYGSSTSLFRDNLITRGNTEKVYIGVEVHGRFQFLNNCLAGFNEQGATALELYPDAIGRANKSQYRSNIFENCFEVITESRSGLWESSMTKDNLAIDCVKEIP